MPAFRVSTVLHTICIALIMSKTHATFFDKDKGSSRPAMPHVVMLPPIVDYESFHHRRPHDRFGSGGFHGGFASDNQVGWLPHHSYLDAMQQSKFGHVEPAVQSTKFDTKIFQHNQVFPQTQIIPQPILTPITNVFSQPQIIPQPQFIPQPQIISVPPVFQPQFPVQQHYFTPTHFFSRPSNVFNTGTILGADAVAASHYATGLLHMQSARAANADPKKKGGQFFKGFFKGKKFRADGEHMDDVPSSALIHKKIITKQPMTQQFMEPASFNEHYHQMYRPHHLEKVKEFIFENGGHGMKMQKVLEFDFTRANEAMGSPVQMLPPNLHPMGSPVQMLPPNLQPVGTPIHMQLNMPAMLDTAPHHLRKRSIDILKPSSNSLDETETEKLIFLTNEADDTTKIQNRSSRYIPPPIIPHPIHPPLLHPPLLHPPLLHPPLLHPPLLHHPLHMHPPLMPLHHTNLARAMKMRRTLGRNYHKINYFPGKLIGGNYRPPIITGFYRYRRSADDNVTTAVTPETSSSPRSNATAKSDKPDEADQKLVPPPVQVPINSPPPASASAGTNKVQTPPGFKISSTLLPRHFHPHSQLMHGGGHMMHMQPTYHPHAFHPGYAPAHLGIAPAHHLDPIMQHGMAHSSFHGGYPMHHGHLLDPRTRAANPTHFYQPQPPVHIHVENSHSRPPQSHHFTSATHSHFNGHQMGHMDHMDSSHHFLRENQPRVQPMFFPPIPTYPQLQSMPPHFIAPAMW